MNQLGLNPADQLVKADGSSARTLSSEIAARLPTIGGAAERNHLVGGFWLAAEKGEERHLFDLS